MNDNSSTREPFTDDAPTDHQNTGHHNTGHQATPHRPYAPRRAPLRRAHQGRMLAGVAAGIADYLGVDVTIVRIAFAVATVLGGAGVPAYLACLLLIPEEGSDVSIAAHLLDSIQSR